MQSPCLKPPNISSPAETIASNQDLLTPILLGMPARSVFRIKCVCKNWFALITSPEFCDMHTSKNPYRNVSAFFFHTAIHDFYFISIWNSENQSGSLSKPPSIIDHPPRIKILQSCNGLLLCRSTQEITNMSSTPRCYFVLNPTTNKFLAITNSPYATKSTSILGVALAFDPSKSLHYKVLCVRCIAGSVISFQIEGSCLLVHIHCKVISYNLRDMGFEKACELTCKGTESKRSLQVGWLSLYGDFGLCVMAFLSHAVAVYFWF